MGDIISRADVQARLKKNYATLYTPRGETEVDTDIVDADIDSAEGLVWARVAKRYQVPVTDATALKVLKPLALAVLEELAYPASKVPEAAQRRIDRANKLLDKIGDGELSLGATPAPTENGDMTGYLDTDGPEPRFTRETMKGF